MKRKEREGIDGWTEGGERVSESSGPGADQQGGNAWNNLIWATGLMQRCDHRRLDQKVKGLYGTCNTVVSY